MIKGNITKAGYQADIKRKQAFFNRCMRRFQVAKTTGEKTFLKNEAKRICTELRQCSKNWKSFGFGGTTWITKNFNMVNFTTVAGKTSRTPSARRTNKTTSRTTARRTGMRTSARRTSRSKVRTNSRTRSNASRRMFVAW